MVQCSQLTLKGKRVTAATNNKPSTLTLICCVIRQRVAPASKAGLLLVAYIQHAGCCHVRLLQRRHVTYTMLGPFPVVHVLQVNLDTFAASHAQPRLMT